MTFETLLPFITHFVSYFNWCIFFSFCFLSLVPTVSYLTDRFLLLFFIFFSQFVEITVHFMDIVIDARNLCVCESFWMQNIFKSSFGVKESNCGK